MNKLFCYLLCLLLAHTAIGQTVELKLAVGGGYGFFPNNTLHYDGYPSYAVLVNGKWPVPQPTHSAASLSNGLHGYLGATYWVANKFGVDLTADLGIVTSNYTYYPQAASKDEYYKTYAAVPMLLCPSLSYRSRKAGNHVYGKLGLAFPGRMKLYTEYHNKKDDATIFNEKARTTTTYKPGFTASFGYNHFIGKHIMLFGELSYTGLSVKPRYGTYIYSNLSGKNLFPDMFDYYKHIYYSEDVKTATNSGSSITLPSYSIPFSNLTAKFGIAITY